MVVFFLEIIQELVTSWFNDVDFILLFAILQQSITHKLHAKGKKM